MPSPVCPECGRALPASAPAGLCPSCLLKLALFQPQEGKAPESKPPAKANAAPTRSFGDYELHEELARGGMGVVFRGRQLSLNRTVAVKLVHGGMFANPAHLKRFKFEAETAARLEHPNIVPIFEVGEHDGQPYFSMKLVEGGTLLDAMKRRHFSSREAAGLMVVVARAVHFAHQRGILHRDLKPTNILLDSDGRPHITDFGLAKLLDDESDLTLTLAVMGTPAYMSPEQAAGNAKDLTTSADIYSLGVVLYELLSGRPPFAGSTTAAVLRQVVEAEPPSLRKRNPAVDADLETICLKCLEKDPARRYATAAELADELERWLAGLPIFARPTSAPQRAVRWARRNPVLASVSGALLLALLVGGVMLDRAYRHAAAALGESRESLYRSMLTQTHAQLDANEMGQRHEVLATLHAAAQFHPSLEVRTEAAAALMKPDFRPLSSWRMYVPTLGVFVGFSPDLQTYVAARLARDGGCELRRAESGALLRAFPHATTNTASVRLRRSQFSPDGRWFVAYYDDDTADIWSIEGEAPILQMPFQYPIGDFDFTPDSRQIVGYATNQGLCAWSLPDMTRRQFQPSGREPRFVRFSPAGDRLAVVRRKSVEILSYPEGKTICSAPLANAVRWAAWHPDGHSFAVANVYDRDIQILDAADATLRARLVGHTHDPLAFEFHPDGQWMISCGLDNVVRFWDARSGQELLHAQDKARAALQFSRDGQRFAASTGPYEIGFFTLDLPRGFREFPGSASFSFRPHNMDLSPSERFLITGANEGVRIWDTKAAREALSIDRPFFDAGYHVFFGPGDREIIYSRKGEGTFRREFTWQESATGALAVVAVGPEIRTPVPKGTFLCSLGADRKTWVSRDGPKGAFVLPEGQATGTRLINGAAERLIVSLSTDERWSAAVCNEDRRHLEIWDAKNLKAVTNMGSLWVLTATFSPDSRWLVGVSDKGHHVWETGKWKEAFFYPSSGRAVACVTFSANGRRLALLQPEDTILLISMPEGRELVRLKPPFALMLQGLALSADGRRLWGLGLGHRVYEWDLAVLRQELAKLGLDWQD